MKVLQKIRLLISSFFIGCDSPEIKVIEPEKTKINIELTIIKAEQAFEFCILIDMNIHSGIKRFIVWDFKNNSISNSF